MREGQSPTLADLRMALEREIEQSEARREQDDQVLLEMSRINNELMSAQRSARESEERLNLTLMYAGVATWNWKLASDSLALDEFLPPLLGLPPGRILETRPSFLSRLHPDDRERVNAELEAAARRDAPLDTRYRVIWPEGEVRFLASRGKILPDSLGEPVRLLGVCWDVTAEERAEQCMRAAYDEMETRVENRTGELTLANAKLQEARDAADLANRAKSEFLSRVSHELRTPMNAILGFGQLLEGEHLGEFEDESVRHIMRAGRHLLEVIDQVLDISRVESGRLHLDLVPIPFGDVLAEAVELVRPLAIEHEIEMVPESPSGNPLVLADAQRLKQVLINLIANAVMYNRPGGRVYVRSLQTGPDHWSMEVEDTGSGLSEEARHQIFAPFERLDAERLGVEGTGLGLTLSRLLVEAMNGSLRVSGAANQGSVFTVELPTAPANLPAEAVHATAYSHSQSDAVPVEYIVLSIEDNLSNHRLIEMVLAKRPNIRLIGAMQGSIGLELVRQHQPDLILLDLHLPDMGGEEVLSKLRASPVTAGIPVVIVSADATPLQMERLQAAGAMAYLTKPLNIMELIAVIDRVIGGAAV